MPNRFKDASKPKQLLIIASFLLVVLIVMFGIGEVGVRLRAHLASPAGIDRIESLYHVDVATGLRVPKAGMRSGAITINALGFRGPEIAVPKPPGTLRFAFLGASTTFAAEVGSDSATWPNLVVEDLRARFPEHAFDYVNSGVPGYVVRTSLENLEVRVAPLDPDVIIIYHATNDMAMNASRLAEEAGLADRAGNKALLWPAEYSFLWYLAEKNLRILARRAAAQDATYRLTVDPERLAAPFREDLTALVRAARRHADVVVVATFSTHLRAEQTPEQQRRAAMTALFYTPFLSIDGLLSAFGAYNAVIAEVGHAEGAVVIGDETRIPGDAVHFVDSVHFTDAGNRVMADRVVEALLAEGVIDRVITR